MPISSTQKLVAAWLSLAALALALTVHLYLHVEKKIMLFSWMFFGCPPLLFLRNLNETTNKLAIKLFGALVVIYGDLVVTYGTHYLTTEGYLVGDAEHTWLEMVRASAALVFFPIYINCINGSDGGNTREGGEGERVEPAPITILLPGGIAIGIAFLPGSLLATVFRTKEFRTVASAYCSYIALVCCMVGSAAAAAWFELLAADTILMWLYVCSSLCVLNCLFLLLVPGLYAHILCLSVHLLISVGIPTLIMTPVLMAYDVELKVIENVAWLSRMIAQWIMIPMASRI